MTLIVVGKPSGCRHGDVHPGRSVAAALPHLIPDRETQDQYADHLASGD